MNYIDEINEILVDFFNEAEADVHSDNFKDGIVITKAGTKASQRLSELIVRARIEGLDTRRIANRIRDAYTLTEAESVLIEAIAHQQALHQDKEES